MLALRRVWRIVVGAWVGAWLARAALDWVLGVDGGWLAAGILLGAAAGGLAGVKEARRVEPLDPAVRRDTVLGWVTLVGAVATIGCLFLPMPWDIFAAAATLAATILVLRHLAASSA